MNANPIPTAPPDERAAYGLHTLVDNIATVALPLKAVDARFEVSGDCAQVSLEQIYEFGGPNPADIIYTFPLPSGASVHQCSMSIDGRKVMAVVKPLEEARTEFQRARAAGNRALLVETVRENLFELRLGNVQPGDSITMAISYAEPLAVEGKQRRLRIPVCPGVRFIPGRPIGVDGGTDLVPDAGRLNPVRIDERHPDAATFFCAGTILGASEIDSPTHEVKVLPTSADKQVPVCFNDDSEVPDRDFILTWQAEDTVLALIARDDPDYLLCSVRAPDDFPTDRDDRDIFFLLDSSSSMIGANWHALVEAVELALAELNPNDRFSVHLFDNDCRPLTEGLRNATKSETSRIIDQLRKHRPRGTTMFTSAFDTLVKLAQSARRPVIVAATDGQIGDEARACAVAKDCGIEVHTVGIDANVNDAVLEKIARRTRGTCSLCVPGEDLDHKIHQLVANLLSPAIDEISAGSEWRLVGNPPPLRRGQAALVPFHRAEETQGITPPAKVEMEMRFADGSRRRQMLDVLITQGRSPGILAAKAGITAHLDQGDNARAVALACRFNVVCEGTAFIAVDESEKVAVAPVVQEQPSLKSNHFDFDVPWEMPQMTARMKHNDLSPPPPNGWGDISYFISAAGSRESDRLWSWMSDFLAKNPPRELDLHPKSPLPKAREDHDSWTSDLISINCLIVPRWFDLVQYILVPWAEKKSDNARIFERLVRDFLEISKNGGGFSKVIECFAELVPFLPEEARIETGLFLAELERFDHDLGLLD